MWSGGMQHVTTKKMHLHSKAVPKSMQQPVGVWNGLALLNELLLQV
jgi:hypothetical protein